MYGFTCGNEDGDMNKYELTLSFFNVFYLLFSIDLSHPREVICYKVVRDQWLPADLFGTFLK